MSSTLFKDLFNEMEEGSFTSSIPAGKYDVVVTDARPRAESNLIFLTLQVLNGPAEGKSTEVNLYFPKEGDKPFASTKWKQKMYGFSAYPDVKAAAESSQNAPTLEAMLDLFAEALIGKQVSADIGLRDKDAGQYAGSNDLSSTMPPTGGVKGPGPAQTTAPAPTPAAETAGAPSEAPF